MENRRIRMLTYLQPLDIEYILSCIWTFQFIYRRKKSL